MISSVLSLWCDVYWRDGQRPLVLPGFVCAGAEEREDVFAEHVVESVDVDFGVDVVERHLGHGAEPDQAKPLEA